MNKSRILSNELKASSHINTCTINCPLTEIQYKASNKTNMENFRNFIYKKADTTLILKINLAYFLLFEIFIKNDASLYKLQLEDRFFSTKNFYNLDELILETPKFISRVKDFRIIISCPEFEAIRKLQNFLSSLPLICNSIKYIELNFPHEVHNKFLQEIKNLFKSQITLSKVLFNRICSLSESLKYCSNTLTSISFHFIIFNENMLLLNEIEHLIHIQSLEFKYCERPELFIQSLLNISIPLKIKTLILDDNVIQSIFPFQLLFHNIGPYLKYLVIIYQPYFIEDFYEFIIQYCEKIEFLYLTEINNYENLFFQIMELFNNNLRYLTLEVKGKLATLYVIKEFVKGKNLEYLTYAITNQFVLSNNLKNLIKETENIPGLPGSYFNQININIFGVSKLIVDKVVGLQQV
ncbi:5909_t:CDS:2 [Rhizophagus irregularis]|nr:5909_t:CDS:2 [Rhizophagus irregularis]